jgi:hypothetical protein
MAAQDGTAIGLAAGLGVGEGLGVAKGVGIGEGLGDALAAAEGDGLLCEAEAAPEQPATANITEASANPLRTAN